ncbi:MAG: sugar phosphate isomerase/epimerase family protein [Bryobacteraceae bacterium]
MGAALGAPAWASNKIGRSRISAITDEIARTPAAAIEFARQYGLQWLELRSVPGARKEYFMLPEAELKQAAKEFHDGGVKISFLNTSMLKYWLPGTEPENPKAKQDPTRFGKRKEELDKAIQAAHILGTTKVRIFTFWRTKTDISDRVAELINDLTETAAREKVQLLIENEPACSVGNNSELTALLKKIPSKWVGINWDPLNAQHTKEIAFPDGYEMLPAKRIWNVQIKGKSVLEGPEKMDWAAIFRRLEKDGYKGQIGLETHIFGEIQVQKSHESIKEILRIVES